MRCLVVRREVTNALAELDDLTSSGTRRVENRRGSLDVHQCSGEGGAFAPKQTFGRRIVFCQEILLCCTWTSYTLEDWNEFQFVVLGKMEKFF